MKKLLVWCLGAVVAGGVTVLASAWLGSTASAAPVSPEAKIAQDWFNQMDAYFAAHPELGKVGSEAEERDIQQEGGGWEPYNALRWFFLPRMTDGELPPVGARWHASEVRQQRLRAQTPRATWFNLGPTNFAGRMIAIDFDPTNANRVFVGGADGGLWRTTDGGDSWVPLTDELPSIAVGGIAVDPLNVNVIVIGTGEATQNIDAVGGVGIMRSTDGGTTWNTTSQSYSVSSGHGFHFIRANPITGTMLAGATNGLWRSTDEGQNWTQVGPGTVGNYYDACWRPGDANVCYAAKGSAGSGNSVKKSTDDGATWVPAGVGQPNSAFVGKTKIAVSAAQPDWVYAVYVNPASPYATTGVYRSTDAGATWAAQNTTTNISGGQGWYNLSLAVDPNNASTVISGGVQLWRSVDAGVTFGAVGGAQVHVDHHAIAYASGSTSEVWVGSDGGIWRSTDDGASWPAAGNRNNGLVTYQFYDICVNNNNSTAYYVMGGTQDNGTDKWSGTTTWQDGLGADGMVCNINPVNGTNVFGEIQFGDHRKNTTSGIGSWVVINSGITGTGQWVTPVAERANPGATLFTETSSGIFRTTDGGTSWGLVNPATAVWLDVSRANGDYVWAVSGTARYSTDNGTTWTSASAYGFPTGSATKILADPVSPNTVYVTFSGYALVSHVARSTDLGATWADVTGDLPAQPVNAIAVNPSHPAEWFIGTDTGVWASENAGVNWIPFQDGLPNAVVDDLEIQDNLQKLVAGTHGRGAWELDIPPSLGGTGVDLQVQPALRNFMLDAPFPNPVSDRTLLRFAVKSTEAVSLAIYDVQGRLVTSLADFSNGDGVIRTTPWYTQDHPSGVYFAVLKAGKDSISRKIVVAK
ncbi:MAG: T9SS type A sorting domain-containing protein [bacterium]